MRDYQNTLGFELECIHLFSDEGLSFREIATRLDTTHGRVSGVIDRAGVRRLDEDGLRSKPLLYGTPEFEAKRNANMAAMRKPVRRSAVDAAETAPFAGLRGAVAHYGAIREKFAKAHVRPVPIVPAPVPETSPAPAAVDTSPRFWFSPVDDEEIEPVVRERRDWLFITSDAGLVEIAGRIRVSDIIGVVAKHYDLSISEMVSHRRATKIVLPRQIAMYIAKKVTTRSFPEIGRRFNGRDHTTVMHAVRKIDALVAAGGAVAKDVKELMGDVLERAA